MWEMTFDALATSSASLKLKDKKSQAIIVFLR
jgi:hypothetical protein